ncbi:MAG: hypothetical protein OEY17_05165 [Nitrosopumilus sp.]|nr:hypothetical protein [Nitrosopumilus sp.]MDH5658710.1 hypothetical protein [Nitrosopumilus sp.]
MLATHFRWREKEDTDAEKEESRKKALDKLVDWIEEQRTSLHVKDKGMMIVLGDFNIQAIGDPLYNTITKNGLETHQIF